MTVKEKKKIIQKALFFLHSAPSDTRKKRRKPHLRAFYLQNSKVFFSIFIPKVLKGNINDQYRRLKDIEVFLSKVLNTKPSLENDRYIFEYQGYKAVVIEKQKIHKGKKHSEYFLLSFFPT